MLKRAAHIATLGLQRGKVLKWLRVGYCVSCLRWLCLHAQHMRL
jgi:hypothetical protein